MCGITGIVDREGRPADVALIRAMTDTLAHRGPDGEGLHVDGAVALGHRRLAIIDLETGAQPMANDDETIWITFNGELYNFRELRRDLQQIGFTFRTTSDTEVLLKAYEAYGTDCLSRLRGMFAFGIWDARRRRVFLARDRVGIKPLVYAWDGRRLLFASELKAILQDPSIERELDWEALRDYFGFLYVPSPRTIFKTIRKLPPACYLVLDVADGRLDVHRYWDLKFDPERGRTEAEWGEGLRYHLEDAVRSHLVSDVPIGAFLSGGMDSSAVVALMAQATAGPVRTFSIGFDQQDFDELIFARLVAQQYQTGHYEFVVKADALDVWPRLAWQFDEPFGDSSALPTYYVAKITREQVTVALSGDGGDENFAGYRRYAQALGLHQRWDTFPGRLLKPLARAAARLLPPGARGRGYAELVGEAPVDRYFQLMTAYRGRTMPRLLTAEARAQMPPELSPAPFRTLLANRQAPDYLSGLQYLDVRTYLPEDILTKVDRTSMLVSLEARVPLLDHRLMEYVATMPAGYKLQNGRGKAIFKQVIAPDLPSQITERAKMGFGVPLGTWFRQELADYTRDLLLADRTRQRGILDPVAVEGVLDDHQRGHRDHSVQIWLMLCLEEWARRWLER